MNPPRAVYVDFPLGHTAGKPHDPELQDAIIEAALSAFETIEDPGGVISLPFRWAENDDWKDSVMRPQTSSDSPGAEHRDDRRPRAAEPQYQSEADRIAAETSNP